MNAIDKNPALFPIHVLPNNLQQVIWRVHAETQAPPPLIASSLLGTMSLSCQDLYDVEPKTNMRHPISLYQMILAESGERKSTVDRYLMSGIRDLEAEWETEYQTQLLEYQTELSIWNVQCDALTKKFQQDIKKGLDPEKTILALRDCNKSKPKDLVRKRILIHDITKAAIKKELSIAWSSLGLYSDEAGSILSGELLDDSPMLNSLWNGSSIEIDRAVTGSTKIEDARFGCMFMVQPKIFDSFRNKKGEQARASGFFARTLFCEPFSTIGSRTSDKEEWLINNSNPEALDWFHKRVKDLLQQSAKRREMNQARQCIRFSPEASARWSDEFNRVESMCAPFGPLVNFRDYASKHAEHVARIAGVLEGFTTGNEFVSDQTMYAAIQIACWYFDSFIYLMSKNCIPEEAKHADLLDGWLNNNKLRWNNNIFPKNYILKYGPNCIRSKVLLDKALTTLQQRGKVSLFKSEKTNYVQYFSLDYSSL